MASEVVTKGSKRLKLSSSSAEVSEGDDVSSSLTTTDPVHSIAAEKTIEPKNEEK